MDSLPPSLLNAWTLSRMEFSPKDLESWTASSLAEAFFKAQLDNKYNFKNDNSRTSSLSSVAIGKILDLLQNSEDLSADLKTIVESLSTTILRPLLRDPRTPYQLLRTFDAVLNTSNQHGGVVDIDEAIYQNEQYIRSRGHLNHDSKYLVSLEDLCSIISDQDSNRKPSTPIHKSDSEPLIFQRSNPLKGGLEVLDYHRPKKLSINPGNQSFCQVFDRITNGILRGLDWNHVMLAGGMALTTLLHVDPREDNTKPIRDPGLELYIYGLGPEDANRKAEEIHDVWVRNLPASATKRLVVKNAKTINLLTTYPNRRIQIVLKLLPSPTDVLLNFDLDVCAIGFDGSHVFMLPRCARAIETGYSVFTMDLVWGHHRSDRWTCQGRRLFEYADDGFGIRFLPSYAQSLEEDGVEAAYHARSLTGESVYWGERNRKPYGGEPGIKTLKRIAYLGQDYVHRFCFGASQLSVTERRKQSLDEANVKRRAKHQACQYPIINLVELDTRDSHDGLPSGRRGLSNLEIFMRHCEAWRLNAAGEARLVMDETSSLTYNSNIYGIYPTYKWDEDFEPEQFARSINTCNDSLWFRVKRAICIKLGIPFRNGGYAHYSTRRIRRQVCGPDLKSIQEKQITIPLMLPWALENYLLSKVPQDYADLPLHFSNFRALIPMHDPSKYDPAAATLPSLRDTASEKGNLRYWVITNESMWANEHRVLDEFAELMWSFSRWFYQCAMASDTNANMSLSTDSEWCCPGLAKYFRHRIVLPEIPDNQTDPLATKLDRLSLREALLFRSWAFDTPAVPPWKNMVVGDDGRHPLFDEQAVLYPFPDDLFWDPQDEGTRDEASMPE